jgi:hypothetical protein
MELKPVFSEAISYLLTDLIPTTAPNNTNNNNNNNNKNENNRFSKYEVFDIFSCSPPRGTENGNNNNNNNSDGGLLYTAMNLPLLNNRILLQETLPEQFEYLSPSQLVPWQLSLSSSNNNNDAEEGQNNNNNNSSSSQLEYVVVPFEIGKTLFEFFDVNGSSFPAESFKR